MGKKRKVEEISDDERIQTVLVRQPFGWNDPSKWDAEDRKRNDNGLYVLVEWLTFVFGGAGEPGMLQNLRRLGYVVEDVWWWSSRNEILVSIHPDINVNKQLGHHYHAQFLRTPAGSGTAYTVLSKARYEGAVQIVGKGEGWKPVPRVPIIEPTSIRTHKFVIPYPTPGAFDPSLPSAGPSDRKPTIKPEPDVKVKPEQGADTGAAEDRSASVQTSDVKPVLPAANVKAEAGEEGLSTPSDETRVKAEPETQVEPLPMVKEEVDSKEALADELAAQRAYQRLLELDEKDADMDAVVRPAKRVKLEQS